MKKSFILGLSFAALLGFTACTGNAKQEENAEQATEQIVEETVEAAWAGTYVGKLPCADCEGIATTLVLNSDNTYTLSQEYLGKENSKFEGTGTIEWAEDQANFILRPTEGEATAYRLVDGVVYVLDAEGNIVEGETAEFYKLIRQ